MTLKSDTELSAVNSILAAIGQAPVTSINPSNPETSLIKQILDESILETLSEGWVFNTEDHYDLVPNVNDEILISEDMLRVDIHDDHIYRSEDIVRRNGKLYDKVDHTDEFSGDVKVTKVWLWEYEELPSVFKRYIVHKASARAAIQLVSNPQLVQMLATQEALSRASCLEYECNQGDYSYFGTPQDSHYTSYKPYHSLARR